MKCLILLAACVAGCATSSYRDRVTSDMVSIRERVSSVESGLAAVPKEVSARLLKALPAGVKAIIIDELNDKYAARIDVAEMRMEELDSGIAAREKRLDELKTATQEFLAKKEELLQMTSEITQAYEGLKSKRGMSVEFDIVTTRLLMCGGGPAGAVVLVGVSQKDGNGFLELYGASTSGNIVYDKTGVFKAGVDENGGFLGVVNNHRKTVLYGGADKEGDGLIEVADKVGKKGVHVGVSDLGGLFWLENKDGKGVFGASAEKNGGYLSVSNNAGQDFIRALAQEDGGILTLRNKAGQEVIHAYADDYGHGYLGVFDRNGKGRTLTPR